MSFLPDHELLDAVNELTIGARRDITDRRTAKHYDSLQERDWQYQMPISGNAGAIAAYVNVRLRFDVEFVRADAQRDSQLIVPHFTFGYHISTPTPVMVTAMVQTWIQDPGLTTTGCVLSWGAWAPDQPAALIPFNGYLHLSFQGYGAPPEVDSSEVADDLGAFDQAPAAVNS